MTRNYISVSWRNLIRNKTFSAINIGGLAIGLAACWLIVLYVGSELSYDRYHANADRIYRIAQHGEWPTGNFHLALTAAPFAPAFRTSFPEVKETVRLNTEGGGVITYQDKHIQAGDIAFADNSFFRVFSYRFLSGNAASLDKPHSMVITKTLAEKIFGSVSDATGKTVSFGGDETTFISGVIEDMPVNSHFRLSAIRSMPAEVNQEKQWGAAELYTYILLNKDADIKKLEAKLPQFVDKYLREAMDGIKYYLELQPLTSIYLHSNLGFESGTNGSMRYVLIFSFVAALILIIASINYMNLTTARSTLRVKEIGIRKVAGSSRWQLVRMFLFESIFITLIASLIAMAIVQLCLPWFQQFTGKEISWQPTIQQTILFCTVFAVLAGCLSGIYPALFLSGFKLLPSLKGQIGKHTGNLHFRQSLVVFQFIITIVMVTGSFIIYQQLRYMSEKDLGFNKDQVLAFHLSGQEVRAQVASLKQQLLQNPVIESVASASNPIGNNNIGFRDYQAELENGGISEKQNMASIFYIDEDFVNTLQVKMDRGRNFSKEMSTDKTNAIMINEALAKKEGWKDPIGKKIQLGKDSVGKPKFFEVIGVMKDFNIYSLQHRIDPLITLPLNSNSEKDNIYVRISNGNTTAALTYIEKIFRKFDTVNPFEYSFLDENFARQYGAEKMQGKLLMTFTILAILISCLGLFGLIAFTAEQRRKEIAIRKVLGSTVSAIVLLLSRDLVKLVVIAMLVATPIAWLVMSNWLQDFAYRVNISWWVFGGAGLITLVIAFVAVSVHAVKAAIANPVKSMRME